MSLQKFIDELKADNIVEAYQIIKNDLTARAESLKESKRFEVAEKFKLTRVTESEKKDDEENMSDEEKEAAAAKEKEEKEKGE